MMQDCSESYLYDAMRNLGEAFDYAVNACGIDADSFMSLFTSCGIAQLFEKRNPKYTAGRSGTELVLDVFEKTGLSVNTPPAQTEYECSSEYWAGWVLAYYQWHRRKTFREIHKYLSIDCILKMYPTLHEASEDKFVDTVDIIFERQKHASLLQQQRKRSGYSQRELAEKSNVNLRTLQEYELRTKDIAKASVRTVLALADALGCDIESIVE